MKNKVGYKMPLIGVIGVLFGRILNRLLTNYFGYNGSNIVFALSGTLVLCVILILIAMKYYKAAILSFIASVPLIISGLGLFFDNMDLVGLGILLIFIIYPITAKVVQKFKLIDK